MRKYRKHLWSKFIKAIRDYNLVEEGDKIAVAISGGKDSLLMAKMFQELKRHGQVNFEVEFIAMDPGYHKDIKQLLIDNCEYLDIPIHLFDSRIFEIADEIAKDYPCYMCARMRIGALYSKAEELEVKRGEKLIELSPKEFKLLEYLMKNTGQVLTREMILNRIWLYSPDIETRVVDVYMGYLRKVS